MSNRTGLYSLIVFMICLFLLCRFAQRRNNSNHYWTRVTDSAG